MQVYFEPSPDVTFQLTGISLAFISGVAAEWVVLRNFEEYQGDSVRVGDVHFEQPPRFTARFASDLDPAAA